jgi:hypothetical protein
MYTRLYIGGSACPIGSAVATPCGLGRYSATLSASCDICPRGFYCGSVTTSNSSLNTGIYIYVYIYICIYIYIYICIYIYTSLNTGGSLWSKASDVSGGCFNGTYCGSGMVRAPDLLRDACVAGYYCPARTPYPLPCPGGTYSPSTGAKYMNLYTYIYIYIYIQILA